MTPEEKHRERFAQSTSEQLLERTRPNLPHSRGCPFWRIGKKHGPCICGQQEAQVRLEDFLATICPGYRRCRCSHLKHIHLGGMTPRKTELACNIMGCECKEFSA